MKVFGPVETHVTVVPVGRASHLKCIGNSPVDLGCRSTECSGDGVGQRRQEGISAAYWNVKR